jgi:hypothetical protein
LCTIPVRANTAAVAPSRRAISGIRQAVALACAARSRCIGTMTSTAPAAGSNVTRQRGRLTSAILLLTNLVPLAGVLWWGWDAFVLLCLYWLETAVIGFWTILRIAILSQANGSPGGRSIAAALALGGFFTVHAGLFMAVHMAFLWLLFAGPWAAKIHDARDFIRLIVIGMGLWIPLAALFAGRGAVFVDDAVNRFAFGKALPSSATTVEIMGGFYKRIVLMHVAIIGGGFVAQMIGTVAPLVVLVLLKTVIDMRLWVREARA